MEPAINGMKNRIMSWKKFVILAEKNILFEEPKTALTVVRRRWPARRQRRKKFIKFQVYKVIKLR